MWVCEYIETKREPTGSPGKPILRMNLSARGGDTGDDYSTHKYFIFNGFLIVDRPCRLCADEEGLNLSALRHCTFKQCI
jgi:hypothetical protein